MPGKRVLVVGDWTHRDFREAVAWLAANTEATFVDSVPAGLAAMSGAMATNAATNGATNAATESSAGEDDYLSIRDRLVPDAILFVQSRPGQIGPTEVERLHAAAPLSRLVMLVGSWCEGELRSGRPCSGVIRILWHQWQPRLIPFLLSDSAPVPGWWRMPRTASLDEQFACTVHSDWPRRQGLVAVHADSSHTFAALSEACQSGGYATVWYWSQESVAAAGVVAVLADGTSCDASGIRFLRQVVRRHRSAPVIALLDFVRRQDYEQAMSEGVFAVLAKPFLVYDLLWHLDRSVACSAGKH